MCLSFPKAPIELLTKLEKRKIGIYRERFAVLGRGHSRKGGGVISISITNGVQWGYPVSAKSFKLQLQQKMKKSFRPGGFRRFVPDSSRFWQCPANTIHASQCCRCCTSSPRQLSAIPHEWLNKKVKVDKTLREMNILIDTCRCFLFV
jgi:hypothetical protein